MGKSSSAVTIGYRYHMGLQMGLSYGEIDCLPQIRAGDLVAWTGNATASTTIRIDAPNLFGGDHSEGGLQGTLDICMGEATQRPNAYLAQQLGTPMPAFRGLVTLVYRGLVGAMNPYIKAWSFQVQRWVKGWRTAVWEPDLCRIDQGMNPAHFVFRAITDPVTGLGKDASALDLDRMKQAAQTLHDEGLGLCLKWSRSDVLGNFIQILTDHVGGDFVDDPTTGKQYLKLYRGDYDVATLPVLDESNVVELTSYEPGSLSGAVNQVTVTYRDCATNKDANVTVQNGANIRAQGRVIGQSTNYPGLWNASLATRIALRDLKAASSGPARLKLKVFGSVDLRKGDVRAFRWKRLNIDRMPLRILEIERGTATDRTITLTCAQDVYSLPTQSYVVVQPPLWTPPDLAPKPVPAQRLLEASYRDLAATLRPADLAQVHATAGYVGALGARPSGVAYNYRLQTRPAGGAFVDVGSGDFAPSGLLATAMVAEAGPTVITLTGVTDLDQAAVGGEVVIDAEICRLVAIDTVLGTLTLARGCVDSVPAAHAIAARVWCTDGFTGADPTEYVTGEAIQAQLLTRTGQGVLDPALAPVANVILDQRAFRPYPPGRLLMQGRSYPSLVEGALLLQWAHRDRLLQADQLIDTTQGDIGPEPGTTYAVAVTLDGVPDSSAAGVAANALTPVVSGDGLVHVAVTAQRDGVASLQALSATFAYTRGEALLDEDGDALDTEDDLALITET